MEFRILGPLQVLRDGQAVEPGSPKQRALLVNLLVHQGQVVSRDRLIEDLWAGSPPSTGLGVLQNYVSQLRKALGAGVVATRGPGYALDVEPTDLDSVRFERLVEEARSALRNGEPDRAVDLVRRALGLWRGPALADVAGEPFAQAEIARLGELRAAAMETELEAEMAAGRHREVIGRFEALLTEHPLRERLWWLLILALYRSGRQADALRTYQRARAHLRDELGIDPGTELRELEAAILRQDPSLDQSRTQTPPATVPAEAPAASPGLATGGFVAAPAPPRRPPGLLLGRTEEREALEGFLGAARMDGRGGLLLLVGEPGIGKTRLLEEARDKIEAGGGLAATGRGYEAELGRPYGAWMDAFRSIPLPPLPETVRTDLTPLLPELSATRLDLEDPNRLYDAVVSLVTHVAATSPVGVLLDDIHWLDTPSTALLHFTVRQLAPRGVAFVATARSAELADNVACRRVVQALRRDDLLVDLPVGPLPAAVIGELTRPIAPDADAAQIAGASNGNPLLALEMARALARGDDPLSSRLDALIGDRLERLGEDAARLVPWMAALARDVDAALLAETVEWDPSDLFEPLGQLERHGVIHTGPDGNYAFTHDLVRSAAYERISTPRRAMLHNRIGRVLNAAAGPDDALAAEAARHADAGGDSATCAAACVRAARRCLRLVAYDEAEELIELGRSHARRLPPNERVALEVQLVHALVHPGLRLRRPGDLVRDTTELCAEAQRVGDSAGLLLGIQVLARIYHWGWSDLPKAAALMQRAMKLLAATDEPNLEPLLEGARCLAYLDIDMERTAELFEQLAGLGDLVTTSHQYQWGLGLVRAWTGDLPEARAALSQAVDLAVAGGDHWATFECTARLTVLELEAGDLDSAGARCAALVPLAARLGTQGSEAAYARAIAALDALMHEEPTAPAEFDDAVAALERIDAGFLAPDLLGIAAETEFRAGDTAAATAHARRGLDLARSTGRSVESARARVLLACLAAAQGAIDDAESHLQAVSDNDGRLPHHVAELRREAERLLDARR
ncbi:MAG TPA: BTAD domain-containing putative transcriptional regulator [Acidimicrobiia bacterium]|nr:BTAD domain-containing putative transcriptional regulator [Acidimicrobiia bacterium]